MTELLQGPRWADEVSMADVLGTDVATVVTRYLGPMLVAPAEELLSRPSKKFRAQLLHLASQLALPTGNADEARLDLAAQAIELLHAGSLIVDDIQDGSAVRRGAPSLHVLYGMPSALCTGNWLYFASMRLLHAMHLPLANESLAFRYYHTALERAHYGQALDLALKVDELPQSEVAALCAATADLKTGSVTGLAMALGGIVVEAPEPVVQALHDFGRSFGCVLQMLDDLGNLHGHGGPEKRYEDLLSRKPCVLWAHAAAHTTPEDYAAFKQAVRQLETGDEALQAWLHEHDLVADAIKLAEAKLDCALSGLRVALNLSADDQKLTLLRKLGGALTHAYG